MSDKSHFDLAHHPFPKNAQGRTFFDDFTSYQRLAQWFQLLVEQPGLGVLTADPGVGKTAAVRNLCGQLPNPDYRVVYICNTSVSPLDLYRTLATELGLRPAHRRGQLWSDIKQALVQMVDARGTSPIVVIDEAQLLSDAFLLDLSGFLNFAFDSRELLTLWLVGLSYLRPRLRQQQHAALRSRIAVELHLEPLDRDTFLAALTHTFKSAGCRQKVLAEPAIEMLYRGSRGNLRRASRLLRVAMREAKLQGQTFLDESVVQTALDDMGLG